MIIKLLGQHNYRNLFNYPNYSNKMNNFEIIKEEKKIPDIVLLSAVMDIKTSCKDIIELKKYNKKLKVILFSEEPLWDLCFGEKIDKKVIYHKKIGRIDQINYFTSNIFRFEKIPYFLTTNPRYILNYKLIYKTENFNNLLQRSNSKEKIFSFSEKRTKDFWGAKDKSKFEQMKLSVIRTKIVEKYLKNGVIKLEGKGWFKNLNRQQLPDWHLDKLAQVNQLFLFGLATENSDVSYYITEKFFDVIFSGSIPLIISSNEINLNFFNKVFNINLKDEDPLKVLKTNVLKGFNINLFKDQVNSIFEQICDNEMYNSEIDKRIKKINEKFISILS